MARFIWTNLIDGGDGDLEFDTSITVGNITVEKNGSPWVVTVNQVNDSYYFTYTESASYTILYSGVAQSELTNLRLTGDDGIADANLNPANVLGMVKKDGSDFLYVYTDGSSVLCHAGNLVNDLTTGGTGFALTAQQGVAIKALIDAIVVPDINTDLTIGDDDNVVGAEVLKTQLDMTLLGEVPYINKELPVKDNIALLAQLIFNLSVAAGAQSWRNLFTSQTEGDGSLNDDVAGPTHVHKTSHSNFYRKVVIRTAFRATDTVIAVRGQRHVDSASTGGLRLTFNGSPFEDSTEYFQNESSEAFEFTVTIPSAFKESGIYGLYLELNNSNSVISNLIDVSIDIRTN